MNNLGILKAVSLKVQNIIKDTNCEGVSCNDCPFAVHDYDDDDDEKSNCLRYLLEDIDEYEIRVRD